MHGGVLNGFGVQESRGVLGVWGVLDGFGVHGGAGRCWVGCGVQRGTGCRWILGCRGLWGRRAAMGRWMGVQGALQGVARARWGSRFVPWGAGPCVQGKTGAEDR